MANTATTTPINARLIGLGALGAALAFFSLANLFTTLTPIEQLNDRIADALGTVEQLSPIPRLQLLHQLQEEQEWALAREPAEPFAWGRLSYLRLETQNDAKAAFAALQMSDVISPGEPRQLPERAVMWWQLRPVETPEQRAYQNELWEKAYGLERDTTWRLAQQNHLVSEVGDALKARVPELYEEWKDRIRSAPAPGAAP